MVNHFLVLFAFTGDALALVPKLKQNLNFFLIFEVGINFVNNSVKSFIFNIRRTKAAKMFCLRGVISDIKLPKLCCHLSYVLFDMVYLLS